MIVRRATIGLGAALVALLMLGGLSSRADDPRGATWLQLTDGDSGRRIFAALLPDGEPVVLNWTNSLFRLQVTEVFVARGGRLELTTVTFADPRGKPAPRAEPSDLDDLYHTGGPFRVEGLSRPLDSAIFRVGQIGDPVLAVGGRRIHFMREVGFGGSVRLVARRPPPADAANRHAGESSHPGQSTPTRTATPAR